MKKRKLKNKVLAVYKGDNFLDIGTISELAKKFNVKETTVYFWAMPVQSKRDKGNSKVAIIVE